VYKALASKVVQEARAITAPGFLLANRLSFSAEGSKAARPGRRRTIVQARIQSGLEAGENVLIGHRGDSLFRVCYPLFWPLPIWVNLMIARAFYKIL
jgi:hypothetical protein